MQEFDSEGLFWLPDSPENDIGGRLRFDLRSGAELSLIGAFGGPRSRVTDTDDPSSRRILGIAGKRLLTLDDCFRSSRSIEIPGVTREKYHVGRVLVGAHFETNEELVFSAVAVITDHLPYWVGRSGINVEYEEGPGGTPTFVSLNLAPLPKEATAMDGGLLELQFTFGVTGDHITESRLDQGCSIKVTPGTATPLDDLISYCGAVQDLVSLAVDGAVRITSVKLWHPDLVRRLPNGEEVAETLQLLTQFTGSEVAPARRPVGHDFLFTFDQVGGLAGLSR